MFMKEIFPVCYSASLSVIHRCSLSCLRFIYIIFTELSESPLPICTLVLPGVAAPHDMLPFQMTSIQGQTAHPPTRSDVQGAVHHYSGQR